MKLGSTLGRISAHKDLTNTDCSGRVTRSEPPGHRAPPAKRHVGMGKDRITSIFRCSPLGNVKFEERHLWSRQVRQRRSFKPVSFPRSATRAASWRLPPVAESRREEPRANNAVHHSTGPLPAVFASGAPGDSNPNLPIKCSLRILVCVFRPGVSDRLIRREPGWPSEPRGDLLVITHATTGETDADAGCPNRTRSLVRDLGGEFHILQEEGASRERLVLRLSAARDADRGGGVFPFEMAGGPPRIVRQLPHPDGVEDRRSRSRERSARRWPRPPPGLPRFLPGACRHGSAPFRAFVRVEGDRPRPRRRERPAGGPLTVFGPRHRRLARWLAKGSAAMSAEAGPSRERNGTRRDRTRAPQKRRARRCREIAGRREASGEDHQARQRPVTRATRARPSN